MEESQWGKKTLSCVNNFLPPFRFGDGYTIILRLVDHNTNPDHCSVSSYMKNIFPSIELKEHHQNVLQYQLPSHSCCLAQVFDVLANNYEELGITDFSVSQTTLDQVSMKLHLQFFITGFFTTATRKNNKYVKFKTNSGSFL